MKYFPLRPLLLTCCLLTGLVHAALASSITSHVVIDPTGKYTGDVFGCSVAWVGDVNNDGYDDALVGAFRYPQIQSYGRAYLYFGGASIDTVPDLVIPPPAGNTAWFGVSVASAGDFNGDGYPDFVIGAQQSGNEGKAFIYYGGPLLDATSDLTLTGETTGSLTQFGASVASAGDVNEDGFDDVIVGAPHYGISGNWSGRAYVYFGGTAPDAVADRVFNAVGAQDQLGTVVGSAGDINGDGHPDVFASAASNDSPVLNAGAIHVWYGGPAFDTTSDFTVHGSAVNERLMNAADAGDINNDGFSDLIGAEHDHTYVWFGGSSPNAVADLTLAVTYASVAGAGDVNGDGIDDFVVGAPYSSTGGAGRASVFFGGSGVDNVEDMFFVGDSNGAIGLVVAGGGHVDGPGPTDLVVSAYYDPDSIGYNKGRVYIYANSFTATAVLPRTPAAGLSFLAPSPNPAWNEVNLTLELDRTVPVTIKVYDVAGREVARPIADERLSGNVTRTWKPVGLPSGVYFIRAYIGDREQVRKMVWMRDRR